MAVGAQTAGSRQEGIARAEEESSDSVAEDVGQVVDHPAAETAVPVPMKHTVSAKLLTAASEQDCKVSRELRRKATEISTRFCALGGYSDLHPKCLIIGPSDVMRVAPLTPIMAGSWGI